jgi:2-isopropylmalate synthase
MNTFEVIGFEVTTRMDAGGQTSTSATVTLKLGDSVLISTRDGAGPLHALDSCLRQCLTTVYPSVIDVRLVDYSVSVLDPGRSTAASVRVVIDWTDGAAKWTTDGVSGNIIEASWLALVDAVNVELKRYEKLGPCVVATGEDYGWGV